MSAALSVYLDVAAVAGTILFACMILAGTLAALAALGDLRLAWKRRRPVGDDAVAMVAPEDIDDLLSRWMKEGEGRG